MAGRAATTAAPIRSSTCAGRASSRGSPCSSTPPTCSTRATRKSSASACRDAGSRAGFASVARQSRQLPGGAIALEDLRRYAVARSLFAPTTLARASTRSASSRPTRSARRRARRTDAAPPRHGLPRRRPRTPLRRRSASKRTSSSTTASCRARVHALMHPRTGGCRAGRRARASAPQRCSPSCASAARCTRARWTRTSRTAR